jgi:DNA-binding NarL/FixJ family response regulator
VVAAQAARQPCLWSVYPIVKRKELSEICAAQAARRIRKPVMRVFMKRITVLIAQDHLVVREGLRSLLRREPDIEVVGAAETAYQAVELARKHRPAVVVMDIAMPGLNGLEAAKQIRHALPATRVIILSAHSDDAYVEKMTRLGAAGFLPKLSSWQLLPTAIREVQSGNTFFRSSVAKPVDGRDQNSRGRTAQAPAKFARARRGAPSQLDWGREVDGFTPNLVL